MPKTLLGFNLSQLRWVRQKGIDPSLRARFPALAEGLRDFVSFSRIPDGLKVIESIAHFAANGERIPDSDEDAHQGEGVREVYHVSFSYATHVPTWQDIRDVKDAFIGPEREAYIVLPSQDRYVDCHPYCLHLWCPLDGPALPDLRVRAPNGELTI